jgi:hypothetical protein
MPTPLDHDSLASTASYLAESELDAFGPDYGGPNLGDENDGFYAEITERRAQLENAEILRGARAL